ncbi:unnamed protein product [Anisakis simplex]|uniref:E3 ubiquitin-protein ligase UBR4 (inferred by orthology to a human protein) n=1 Tax=Anisakis simplex TaxID=6269 RepID=A0A158PNE0_ANISI|nr:unnamed protein product [Anisakis simplex]
MAWHLTNEGDWTTIPNSQLITLLDAIELLMKRLRYFIESDEFECEQLANVLSCFINVAPLPFAFVSSLMLNPENQISIELESESQQHQPQSCNVNVNDVIQAMEVLIMRYFPLDMVVLNIVPKCIRDLVRDYLSAFQTHGQIQSTETVVLTSSLVSSCQEGLNHMEKLLNQEVCASLSTANELINGLILLCCSTAVAEHPDITDDNLMNFLATIISLHKNLFKSVRTYSDDLSKHYNLTLNIFIKSISNLVVSGKNDFAYLLTNYFLATLPKLLIFIAEQPINELLDLLWNVAVCSLQDEQKLADENNIKKSLSTDSSDDPISGVGDWLANILSDVPAMIDQQEAALNAKCTSLFVVSTTSNSLAHSLLYLDVTNGLIPSNVFCLTIAAEAALLSASSEVPVLTNEVLMGTIVKTVERSATREDIHMWLFECICEALPVDDLCKDLLTVVDLLHDALISHDEGRNHYNKRIVLNEMAYIMLFGSVNDDKPHKSLQKFHTYANDLFDVSIPPDWSTIRIKCNDINYSCWSQLHSALLKWYFSANWNDEHLPIHASLPAPTNFFKNILDGRANCEQLHHFIRLRPLLMDDKYAQFIKAFNDDDPGIDITKLRSIETFCNVGVRVLKQTNSTDLKMISAVRYDALLLMLNMLKSEQCSDDFLKRLAGLCDTIRCFAENEMCERAGIKHSKRSCNVVLSLSNSQLLNSIVPSAKGVLQASLNDSLLKFVKKWSCVAHPELHSSLGGTNTLDVLSDSFTSPISSCSFAQPSAEEMFDALNSVYDNALRFMLCQIQKRHLKNSKSFLEWKLSEKENCLDWILSVQSSQLSSPAVTELCSTILKGSDMMQTVKQRQLLHDLPVLLDAILIEYSSGEMNLLDPPSICCTILKDLVLGLSSDMVSADEITSNLFANLLDRIMNESNLNKQSIPLISFMSSISCCNNAALISIFLEPLKSRLHLLAQWMRASEVSLETFSQLHPLLKYLKDNCEPDKMELLLDAMLEVLFGKFVHQQLVEYCPLIVRRSDRWNYAALSARRDLVKEGQVCVSSDQSDLFGDTIVLLISVGGSKIHQKLIFKFCDLFAYIISNTHESDYKILEGGPGDCPNSLAYSFIIMCDILEYINALSEVVSPLSVSQNSADEPSFSVIAENFVTKQSSSAIPKAPVALPLCTYSATQKQFILQHWYHCYTCGMEGGEGVCSVCAVNCHRGHDISYSKQGSFFCDCGAKGCQALKSTQYPLPTSRNESMTVISSTENETQNNQQLFRHKIFVQPEDRPIVKRLLESFSETLSTHRSQLDSILRAILIGCEMRSITKHIQRINDTRLKLLQPLTVQFSRSLMKYWTSCQKVLVDKKPEGSRFGQIPLVVVRVGGSVMLATVQEGSKIILLSTHALFCVSDSGRDLDMPRIDMESVGFKIVSMCCVKDLLVACGNQQFIVVRFKANGDVQDKRRIPIKGTAFKSVIAKVQWIEASRRPLVAIATEHFVRIYDVGELSNDPKFEFVVPLGTVVDMAFAAREQGGIEIFVLSSAGHIYFEQLEKADSTSYYIMNTVSLPYHDNAVSLHYSEQSRFLFVSQNEGTYVVRFTKNDELGNVQQIGIDYGVWQWSECAGVISALSHPISNPNMIVFFYFCADTLYIQSMDMQSAAQANCMLLSAGNTSYLAIQIVDNHTLQFYKSEWQHEPDLWIRDVEYRVLESNPHTVEIKEEKQSEEDLVTIFESCVPLEKVQFWSKALELSYDADELTKRLKSPGMSAVCLKKKEFDIVVRNLDWNMVICGLRVEVAAENCPQSVNVFGKNRLLRSFRARIYDIPLTRKQSLECGNEVTLTFTTDTLPAQVTSVMVYGKTKRDFGFPTATYRLEQALTLPERTGAAFMSTCAHLWNAKSRLTVSWMLSCASMFDAPGHYHNHLRMCALDLLAVLTPNPDAFFNEKDSTLFARMRSSQENETLQLSLLNAFAAHAKQMLLKRPLNFHRYMTEHFGNIVRFLEFLSQGFHWKDTDREPLLDCYLITCSMYMAAGHVQTPKILSNIGAILFSEDVLFASRAKQILADRVAHYARINVQQNASFFSTQSLSSLITSQNDNKIVSSESLNDLFNPTVVDILRSALSKPELNQSSQISDNKSSTAAEKYYVAGKWITTLLEYVINAFDRCDYEGYRCIAAAQMIIHLFGQHTVEQLTPVVDLFSCRTQFYLIHAERTPANERHEVYVRMAIAVLSLCSAALSENASGVTAALQTLNLCSNNKDKDVGLGYSYEEEQTMDSVNEEEDVYEDEEEDGDTAEDEQQADNDDDDTTTTSDIDTDTDPSSPIVQPNVAESLKKEKKQNAAASTVNDQQGSAAEVHSLLEFARNFAKKLVKYQAMDYCFAVLSSMWSTAESSSTAARTNHEAITSVIPRQVQPNMSPLFDSHLVAGRAAEDMFDSYTTMLTESALRLAYALKKILPEVSVNEYDWHMLLSDYKNREPEKHQRLARRLLLLFCGDDKKKYREVRDKYLITNMLRYVKNRFDRNSSFEYTELSDVVLRLHALCNLADHRPHIWQKLSISELPWLLNMASTIPEEASGRVLQVISLSLRPNKYNSDDRTCCAIVNHLIGIPLLFKLLCRCLNRYLMNEESVYRFAMHAILRSLLQLAERPNQVLLMRHLLYQIWPKAQHMGSRAAQLVDIIASYAPRFCTMDELASIYANVVQTMEEAITKLETQDRSVLITKLKKIIGTPDFAVFNGTACLICSRPEVHMDFIKLSAIKLDSRFTTSAQMIKLMGHFEVSRVVIHLTDIKRSKMIKHVRLNYCNKELESAVDLKNRPELWEKAADVEVSPGETEIAINLIIPIVTCNIVLEMIEFYETSNAVGASGSELVHCPRCTTAVAPNPGICSNCGENVFQCVKCRAINYDEKEPFLCNSCGFCKYARLESTLLARPLPSVQPIENDAERIAAREQIIALLKGIETDRCEIAILVELMEKESWTCEPNMRPNVLMRHVSRERFIQFMVEMDDSLNLQSLYNKAEQLHKNLINQTRRLVALRTEMYRYDVENGDAELTELPIATGFYSDSSNCYGCQSALVIHNIALLQAVCSEPKIMDTFINDSHIFSLLVNACSINDKIAHSIHVLIQKLAEVSEQATQTMCQLALKNQFPAYLLARPILEENFRFWDIKLRCLMQLAITGNGDSEVDMHAISVLRKLCSPCMHHAHVVEAMTRDEHANDNRSLSNSPPVDLLLASDDPLKRLHDIHFMRTAQGTSPSQPTSVLLQTVATADTGSPSKVLDLDNEILKRLLPRSWNKSKLREIIVAAKPFPFLDWLNESTQWITKYDKKRRGNVEFNFAKDVLQDQQSSGSLVDIWLGKCIFSPVASIRLSTYRLLLALCFHRVDERSYEYGSATDFALVIQRVLLWLDKLPNVNVNHREEYFCLVRTLVSLRDVRQVLISKPVQLLSRIFNLIRKECKLLMNHKNEGLPGDLCFGSSVLQLVELVLCVMSYDMKNTNDSVILREYGAVMVETFLEVIACFSVMSEYENRSRVEVMAHITSVIMRFAINSPKQIIRAILNYLKRHSLHRHVQAYFLHLLGDIVHPPVKKEESFLIQIEKDPLQEEYLQGRMPGNPYKSADTGMGPLMRDIKNKICRDCELVALLEEDTGMELLINQQIIALDLPVAEVYEKLWRRDHPDQPMIIVYRMRGLLGDATEPFIQSLADTSNKESVNDAQLRLAAIFGELNGLKVVISLLDDIELTSATKNLITRMYQLLFYCVKMEKNRWQLIENGAVSRLLQVFERIYQSGVREETLDTIALQSLQLCKVLLTDVVAKDRVHKLHSIVGAKFEQMSWLLELSERSLPAPIWEAVTTLVPNLCLGNNESMDALVAIFRPCCDWEKIDRDRAFRDVMTKKLDTMCSITYAIPASESGAILKRKLMDAGIVACACDYLSINHPPLFNVSVEGPEWKQFLGRAALKYVLKLLAGMARTHKPSQEAIAEHTLPILHRLEQISSAEHIGTLAENVMEELKQNETVASEKRQLAMLMRQKQLSKMGMQVSQKGQVRITPRKVGEEASSSTKTFDVLSECCICREGLDVFDKVMMVYAFASRQELSTPVSGHKYSFTTVSQMNLVHLDCHTLAVRMANGRDEWSSASLHNANTKCNIMVPIWSVSVKDTDMANALQRLSNDLKSAVGFGTLSVETVLLDMTQLLDRFVKYRSFSELSHGGGRESNLQFLSVLLLLALHLRSSGNTTTDLKALREQLASSIESRICLTLIDTDTRSEWNQQRFSLLQEIHSTASKWDDAKPLLLLWAIINHFHTVIIPESVSDRIQYLRANVTSVSKQCSEFVNKFDNALVQTTDFASFCEIIEVGEEERKLSGESGVETDIFSRERVGLSTAQCLYTELCEKHEIRFRFTALNYERIGNV